MSPDLEPNPGTLQAIDDDFGQNYRGKPLHSFVETIPSKMGLSSCLVVERASAVLGYPEERSQAINADHRHVCKFNSISDPNDVIVRDSLASTIADMLEKRGSWGTRYKNR